MVITATGSFVKYVDINKDHSIYLETFMSNGCLKMAMKCYSNLYHNNWNLHKLVNEMTYY